MSLAGFMSVWLSGALFLLCCHVVTAAPDKHDSCPMAKMSHHCDKAKHQDDSFPAFGKPDLFCVGGCAYLPAVFDKSRKIETIHTQAAPAGKTVSVRFDQPVLTSRAADAPSVYSRLHARKKIFVTNCNFRI
jgi:hypothetical protein